MAIIFEDNFWVHPNNLALDPELMAWLLDPDSLTAKLKTLYPDFAVRLLSHEPAVPAPSERILTGADRPFQAREVVLQSADTPLVFARSLIPDNTCSAASALNNLGNQPLGEALFEREDVDIGPISVCRFKADSQMALYNQELTGERRELWGRRRLFTLDSQPVLVAEVFLSPAPCYK
ncbi:chorismate--pyruvate lyase family protein [Aliidiomarina sp. Khilg15.8]